MDRYGSNKYSGKYTTQHVTCRRADGTTARVLVFQRGSRWSFDEHHWAATKAAAFQQATHCYEAAWGTQRDK